MLKRFLLLMLLVMVAHSSVAAQGDYAEPSALADEDGKFVMVNEASVYYLDRGPADGEPVVLLHGFLGSVIDWTNTIPALTEAGYRVIAFDRPPFGLSDKRTDLDYSTKAMSELTAGLLDELKITQFALVGHSAGGLVAADFTLRYPDRVTRLVLVDAAIGLMDADVGEDSNQAAGAFGFLSNVDPDSPLAQAAVSAFFNSDFAASLMTQAVNDTSMLDSSLLELRQLGNLSAISALTELQLITCDLNRLVREIAYARQPAVYAAGITLQLNLALGILPALVDEDRLQSALIHLLNNAITYTPPGGQVTLRTRTHEHTNYIDVIDTGIGIDPQYQSVIFDLFYRLDDARSLNTGGVGLGLSIARLVAEAHGGSITVVSTLGQGSTFTLSLPAVDTIPALNVS